MENVQIDVPCACCKAVAKVKINTWTGEYEIVKPPKSKEAAGAKFAARQRVLSRYMELKGITKNNMPTWEAQYRGRAFKAIDKLLGLFSALPDPVGVAIECLEESREQADRKGWNFNLEAIAYNRAPEWLLQKQKEASR